MFSMKMRSSDFFVEYKPLKEKKEKAQVLHSHLKMYRLLELLEYYITSNTPAIFLLG